MPGGQSNELSAEIARAATRLLQTPRDDQWAASVLESMRSETWQVRALAVACTRNWERPNTVVHQWVQLLDDDDPNFRTAMVSVLSNWLPGVRSSLVQIFDSLDEQSRVRRYILDAFHRSPRLKDHQFLQRVIANDPALRTTAIECLAQAPDEIAATTLSRVIRQYQDAESVLAVLEIAAKRGIQLRSLSDPMFAKRLWEQKLLHRSLIRYCDHISVAGASELLIHGLALVSDARRQSALAVVEKIVRSDSRFLLTWNRRMLERCGVKASELEEFAVLDYLYRDENTRLREILALPDLDATVVQKLASGARIDVVLDLLGKGAVHADTLRIVVIRVAQLQDANEIKAMLTVAIDQDRSLFGCVLELALIYQPQIAVEILKKRVADGDLYELPCAIDGTPREQLVEVFRSYFHPDDAEPRLIAWASWMKSLALSDPVTFETYMHHESAEVRQAFVAAAVHTGALSADRYFEILLPLEDYHALALVLQHWRVNPREEYIPLLSRYWDQCPDWLRLEGLRLAAALGVSPFDFLGQTTEQIQRAYPPHCMEIADQVQQGRLNLNSTELAAIWNAFVCHDEPAIRAAAWRIAQQYRRLVSAEEINRGIVDANSLVRECVIEYIGGGIVALDDQIELKKAIASETDARLYNKLMTLAGDLTS